MKLSQWHDGSVKPVHVGVYERRFNNDSFPFWSSFWDGDKWNSLFQYKENAARSKYKSNFQNLKLRGVVRGENEKR